ncbi:MAG: CBS domain-containing protein [Actinomycetota bacterium]|jgi:CBS domain-containing protein|nr:CBS domain-containing protein [Actinomycetota bacterium]MCL6093999.1 CBS domain-containing protein [Actinomycetota bacterium]MDA8167044.1 CBS domain-containing protein [Actinomycetota bacterium]
MFFLSKILGQQVKDSRSRPVGTLDDIVVSLQRKYPSATKLLVKSGRRKMLLPWDLVRSFEESQTMLRLPAEDLKEVQPVDNEIFLAGDILDKQIVDTEGHKLIRVNDLQLARANGSLRVVGVDIGSGAIMRRLGLSRLAERLSRRVQPTLLDWKTVEPVGGEAAGVKLKVTHDKLALLHPADIADIANELSPEERMAVVESLDAEVAADMVEEMDPHFQAALLNDLDERKAAALLSNMDPDDAADLLADLPEEKAATLLTLMRKKEARDVRELLAYDEETAGGIMTTEYVAIPPGMTAGEAIDKLRELEPGAETINYVYVIDDDDHLVGVFSLRDLILARRDQKVEEFMERHLISVRDDAGQVDVAQAIAKYNLLAVPVTDKENKMRGIITVDDAIDIILPLTWKKRLPKIFG